MAKTADKEKGSVKDAVGRASREVDGRSMSEVGERLRKLVVEHLRIDEAEVTEDANFRELGADSLDAVQLVIAFEHEFGCTIPDEEVGKLATVKGAISYFESVRSEPAAAS